MSGEETAREEPLSLTEFVQAGISKAVGKNRGPGLNPPAAVLRIANTRNQAPVCGVSAILPRDDGEADPTEQQHDSTVAQPAMADTAGEWIAEDIVEEEDDTFCWEEEDEEADDAEMVR